MGIRQAGRFSPGWQGAQISVFSPVKWRPKSLALAASQALRETGTRGRCVKALEIRPWPRAACPPRSPAAGSRATFLRPGLIEHEGRDVVIALKTRQAIRNVISKALKNLTFLWSRGIIDKHEGTEVNKVTADPSVAAAGRRERRRLGRGWLASASPLSCPRPYLAPVPISAVLLARSTSKLCARLQVTETNLGYI